LKVTPERYHGNRSRSSVFSNLPVLSIVARSAMERRSLAAACIVLLATAAILSGGCASARVSGERQIGATPIEGPSIVYVTDFELDASNVHEEHGILPSPLPAPLGLRNALPRLRGSADPTVRARELVELMSNSLVQDLAGKGVQVRRIQAGGEPPAQGWLVRGVFAEVQEGNQLRRAIIGFGAGHTELQVLVAVDDLTRGAAQPMYEVDTQANSGKIPGAVITLNPYVAAARFVLSGKDLDRNVKQTAARIADQVERRIKQSEGTR
jgi:hypothetical protein